MTAPLDPLGTSGSASTNPFKRVEGILTASGREAYVARCAVFLHQSYDALNAIKALEANAIRKYGRAYLLGLDMAYPAYKITRPWGWAADNLLEATRALHLGQQLYNGTFSKEAMKRHKTGAFNPTK